MKVSFTVACPQCDADDLDPGPGERVGGRISRIGLACGCGWVGTATVTLVTVPGGRLDHLQERLDVD